MSETESDELERIREQKRKELLESEDGDGSTGSADEPIYADGYEDFNRLVGEYDIVLADFYADWCGPCQMLEPILESVAANTDATVVKVDTDQYPALAREHGVRGLPTLVVFSNGQPGERLVGLQDETTLTNAVESYAN